MNTTNIVLGKFRKCYPAQLSNNNDNLIESKTNNPAIINDFGNISTVSINKQTRVSKYITDLDTCQEYNFVNEYSSYSKIG